ncbi:MAG TPA: Gfo/Idh/MocA family oxidoreductase [Terracidiphilus sp.]|nr:Gfo/Idh/MocA family oxidoreductase [Terracidiphilus sp.]
MIRAGLVGFGMAGRVFHGPLLSSVEGLELAAVMERSTNKAAERYPGITVYRSLEAMLADKSLGLFVVATPNETHYALAKEILSAGKNVVVDKPMTLTSAEAAELIGLAKKHNVLLAPFHNRRWDSDFLTVQKLLHEGALGRLVALESRFDRWRPARLTERLWKEGVDSGGMLQDLGPHLVDQAVVLFGKPEAVSAEVLRERDGAGPNDSFTIRLRYPGLIVTVASNLLSLKAAPRYRLRGTRGGYVKKGVDPQEAALSKITRIEEAAGRDAAWGQEPSSAWGLLYVDIDGGSVSRPVPAVTGDYRLYYAGIRDALLGKAPAPVTGVDGWRVARLLEWAVESSEKRREIACDWSGEPE